MYLKIERTKTKNNSLVLANYAGLKKKLNDYNLSFGISSPYTHRSKNSVKSCLRTYSNARLKSSLVTEACLLLTL